MPDITLVAPPFLGHLTQLLALAENLAARGHVVHVVTSHTRAQEVCKAGAKLIPWEIADDGEALTAVWRHATRAQAWAGERIMLSYLVEHYDTIYESLRKLLLARRGDFFVFDRALIPAMDLALQFSIWTRWRRLEKFPMATRMELLSIRSRGTASPPANRC